LIQARNSAETTYHSFNKDFDEYKDQVTEDEKVKAQEALDKIQEALKGEDVEAINKSVTDLYQAIGPVTAKKYEAEEAAKKAAEGTTESKTDDNVVDAEVKESK